MCAVKHTVYDPRQLQLAQRRGGDFFDVPGSARSAPVSSGGRGPRLSQPRTGLRPISECGAACSEVDGAPQPALAVRARAKEEPWRSPLVADFAAGLGRGVGLEAMVLQGPRGVALRAVGEAEDHQVASRKIADIEARRKQLPSHGPSVDLAEGRLLHDAKRRNAVRRGSDLALAVPSAALAVPSMAFGAVYEYRDACGTAKVVASTATLPERQLALDQRHYEDVLPKSGKASIVWVGISGGRGGMDEAEMAEVRRQVASSRADRLQAQKLSDIKPYSRHG
ncbi:unnamed protein product [Polarella glacialis]|uniref:Uncharacterized protein n=1 Tax=Polarella glacialis TaxID=89957 RepID=A0A813KHU7_POLGL|nr:unnamed protein product [Polarella glacialis]